MRGYDVPPKERVRARNLDHRIAKEEARTAAMPTGATQAATGTLLADRQGLFKEMESAGPQGISQAMRERGRALGVADSDFNSASERVRKNASFTPGSWRDTPVTGSTPATGSPVNPTPAAQAKPTPPTAATPSVPKVNPQTGMKMGTLPGDPGYNPKWRNATPESVTQPNTAAAPKADIQFGKEVAETNLAERGLSGAVADYNSRKEAEKKRYRQPPI